MEPVIANFKMKKKKRKINHKHMNVHKNTLIQECPHIYTYQHLQNNINGEDISFTG